MPAAGREALMLALAGAIEGHGEEFAQIESLDNGKPVGLAQYVDVRGTAAHLRYFAGWPTKIEGAVLPVAAGPDSPAPRRFSHCTLDTGRRPHR